jgi:hypothetical protein
VASNQSPIWLDRILVVPAIGITCMPKYPMAFRLHESLMGALHERSKAEFSFTLASQTHLQHTFQLISGYSIELSNQGFTVKFTYPGPKTEPRPGTLPSITQLAPKTFTELLLEARELFDLAFRVHLDLYKSVVVKRFGIVAQAELDNQAAPAGIKNLIDRISANWKRPLVKMDTTLVADLKNDETCSELCHHILRFDRNAPAKDLLGVMLDWQRTYLKTFEVHPETASSFFNDCQDRAIDHFENIGNGRYEYEHNN